MELLRTLTRKSKLPLGKYANQTVEAVLRVDPLYIWYQYYKIEKMAFTDDILKAVGITQLIKKPGIAPEIYKQHCSANYAKEPGRQIARQQKNSARRRIGVKKSKKYFSKGNMQARNHGRL